MSASLKPAIHLWTLRLPLSVFIHVKLTIDIEGKEIVLYRLLRARVGRYLKVKEFVDEFLSELFQIANNPFRSIFYWKNHPNQKMSKLSKIRVLHFKDIERIPLYGKKYKPIKIIKFIRTGGKKAP